MRIFGMWEETRANPHRRRESVQTPTNSGPNQESGFFFFHPRYNRMTLNEMMLFGDLLYSDASSLGCGDVIREDGEMAEVLRNPASEALELPGLAPCPSPSQKCSEAQWR